MDDRELRRSWEDTAQAEKRGYLEGHRIGFWKGVLCGVVGAVVLIVAASDLLWAFR